MARRIYTPWIILAGVLLLTLNSAAQVTIGDNVSLTSSGTFNVGYNDTYGNLIPSSHGLGFGGTGSLNGYYYDPNFISFNLNPYFNQSRSNSGVGSVTNASGVTLSSTIFGGSHFPGSVNYSANFNSTGNYGIPGISSLNTDGNNQTFGINWGAFLPGLPTLSVGYQQGNSNYSLYGTNQDGSSAFKSFTLTSTYNLFGFGLSGGIAHGTSDALIPGVLIGGQTANANSDNTNYVISASHQLPWNGTFNTSYNRTDLNSDYLGYTFNGNIDVVTANAGLHPTPKLAFALSAGYTDNLSGSLYQALIPGASTSAVNGASTTSTSATTNQSATTAGNNVLGIESSSTQQSSNAFSLLFNTSYSFAPNLQLQGSYDRRQETYFGETFGSNLYNAGVYYNRPLAGGFIGSSFNVFDSTLDGSSQNNLGFASNTSYGRRFGQWQFSGYFNYVQNVQTYLVTYNTSAYSFAAGLSRKIGARWYWSGSASAGRTGLTAQPGSNSSSASFSTNLTTRKYGFGASYNKSDGNSLAGGNGLITTPLPPIIPSYLLVGYGGTSYSVSASAAPIRNFNASFSYVNSRSNFNNVGVYSWNNFEEENAYLQYQFRQIGLNGGWTHLVQGFSASGTPPASYSSFYVGVYRWFNFF